MNPCEKDDSTNACDNADERTDKQPLEQVARTLKTTLHSPNMKQAT